MCAEVDETARIDPSKEFDDIKVKLDALTDLPEGAGPLQFIKEFGETSALMLTVASPPASGPRLRLLAELIASALPAAVASSLDVVLCSSAHRTPRSCAKPRDCWEMPWSARTWVRICR